MTMDQVTTEFVEDLDFSDGDGNVSRDEFFGYYTSVSTAIEDDSYFNLLVWNAWLTPNAGYRRRR